MKEITEQQIRQRAREIGNRPAFPCDWQGNPNGFQNSIISNRMPGMTYYQYLIGQHVANPTGRKEKIFNDVQYILEQLAIAELEAEQEVQND
jgi:hypothetical protein